MIVLGIADNHDSGAALVIDGELVRAVNQERIDRVKNSGAFPWGAIDATLAAAGLPEREVDRIVIGTGFTPSILLRAVPRWHADARQEGGQFSPLLHAYILYQSALRATGLHSWEVDTGRALLRRRLRARPFSRADVVMMDHHRAHAQGAYRTQGYDHCLVLTVDAMGDGTTATVAVGRAGALDFKWRQSGLAAVNTFYSRITEFLGFRANRHEGKITGLAAYVEPPPKLLRHLRTRLSFRAPGFSLAPVLRAERPDDPFWSELRRWSREEVASAAQRVLEESVTAFVRHWVRQTGCPVVALAGGVFANVKLNQRIAELDEIEEIWVYPHMGDGGLPAGAALGTVDAAPKVLPHAYLGPEYTERDLYRAVKRGPTEPVNLGRETTADGRPADVERVARLLADGKVVASFDGAMEWGPRALGNRTVLARPHDPTINDWLNKKLDRSEFMPFAPVVRAADAGRWFRGVERAPEAARFMTVCFDATPEFREKCSAAVHVDGTARPQLVRPQDNPRLHRLLDRVGELTGVPALINTSFNLHEEPIVCTPDDAVKAWQRADLDALWLGPFVAERRTPGR